MERRRINIHGIQNRGIQRLHEKRHAISQGSSRMLEPDREDCAAGSVQHLRASHVALAASASPNAHSGCLPLSLRES